MWNSTGRKAITVCADYMCCAHMSSTPWTNHPAKRLDPSGGHLHDGLAAAVRRNSLGQQFLAEIDLRLRVVGGVAFVLHHLEAQMIERAAHVVELVLGLDDDLVEALLDRPQFLLLGERAEETLSPPVAACAADPGVEHAPAVELHIVVEPVHQVDQLRLR